MVTHGNTDLRPRGTQNVQGVEDEATNTTRLPWADGTSAESTFEGGWLKCLDEFGGTAKLSSESATRGGSNRLVRDPGRVRRGRGLGRVVRARVGCRCGAGVGGLGARPRSRCASR